MNKFVWVLLGVGAAAGATTLHLVAELRAERENSRKLQARVAELERLHAHAAPMSQAREIESGPEVESTLTQEPSAAPPPTTVGVIAPATPTPQSVDARSGMRAQLERRRALMRDPAYREAMLAQQKAMMPHQYPDLAAELGLSANEADRFITLLANQQVRSMEVLEPVLPYPGQQQDEAAIEERRQRIQQWQEGAQAELKGHLGEEKYRAWQEYQTTMGVRHQVRELNNTFAAAGEPLQESQLKALREAFADVQKQQSAEAARSTKPAIAFAGRPGPDGVLDPAAQLELEETHLRLQREHHERLRHAASSILSASQMKQLEAQQDAQLKMHEAHLRMRRAQSDAEARGEVQALFAGDGVVVLTPPNTPPPQ